ncbi:gliding motility-associated peptidyl-prolyl isomerase [Mesonia hippocampi]|uniref:Peptidyl-prolyl cis-trans isomerase n=1 Tax=Mesonia hippocampi TaxID=1628250 RepID=A0A840EPZ4_9FLAO|nr:gliding motility-associated peptidyl-prolyl isomerase GldI [Mesonia hippocampi]MBB4119155.1 gliding motility-associated peptidyl-prolyl isomerase [Mesonia hippocampi]
MKTKILLLFSFICILACKSPEPRKPVVKNSGSFIRESVNRNKKLIEKEENQILSIIEKDTAQTYHASSNGFWYTYHKKNNQDTLQAHFGDEVIFEYNISTLDGTPIYTTKEIGTRSYVIDKENVFNGLRQGLKLMKEGETATFLFPSYNAFGYYGDNNRIGTNVPIKTTITLKDIKPQHIN